MDINQLIGTVGLWPAITLMLAWWIDRIRREQLAERDRRIAALEDEAKRSLAAKDAELAEWKKLQLDTIGRDRDARGRRP